MAELEAQPRAGFWLLGTHANQPDFDVADHGLLAGPFAVRGLLELLETE